MNRPQTAGAILVVFAVQHVLPWANAEDADNREYVEQLHATVNRFTIVMKDDMDTELQLRPQPILKWGNPVRGIRGGAAFVWVSGVRPMAVGTVFLKSDGPYYELHSLADAAVVGHYEKRRIWYPEQPGLRFIDLSGEQAPGDSTTIRLRQLKKLSRQFTAITENQRRSTEGQYHLRLLIRPIYRYADVDAGIIDGAIFAFTQGTDPEVLLVLEAVSGTPSAHWRVAFARLAFNRIEVRRNDDVVWSAPQARGTPPESIHFAWKGRK